MVVIKETLPVLKSLYGSDFISKLDDYSNIIGYTLEQENQEIKVEFNPDRPDLFSFTSLNNAMEIYSGRKSWKPLSFEKKKLDFIIDGSVRKLRPYTIGFHCEGDAIGDHFRDLIDYQERIHSSVGKDRSKVSIGIHDTRGISGPIHYRAYNSDEIVFTTYDGEVTGSARKILEEHPKGQEYGHLIPSDHEVPIIEDDKQHVLSMPPVINGDTTAVSPKTKSFFIDMTGTDLKALRDSFFLLAYFFSELEYRLSLSDFGDLSKDLSHDGRKVKINSGSILELTGTSLKGTEIKPILERMGYKCTVLDDGVVVEVPGNRSDVMGPADIIEDIAKGYGYDNIVPKQPQLNLIGDEVPQKSLQNLVREIMVGLGHQEIMSYVVTAKKFYEGRLYRGELQVQNPKSLDYSVVRDRLSLGVLDFLRINKRRNLPQNLFEIGEILIKAKQHTRLCILKANSKSGYSDIKQALDAFLARLGIHSLEIQSGEIESLIHGRSGYVKVDGRNVGVIGEVHPETLNSFELKNPVSYTEIDLTDLSEILDQ